jgi:hypothetical protein
MAAKFSSTAFPAAACRRRNPSARFASTQNPFSGEYDKLGFGRIEIFTKPGSDKFHGTASYDISDGVWNARNPFITFTPFPGFKAQTYGGNVSGPLTSTPAFFLDVERRQIDDNGILNATILDPTTFRQVLDRGITPTPQQRTTFSPRVDWALSGNNTLSVRYSYLDLHRDLWGVGLSIFPATVIATFNCSNWGKSPIPRCFPPAWSMKRAFNSTII